MANHQSNGGKGKGGKKNNHSKGNNSKNTNNGANNSPPAKEEIIIVNNSSGKPSLLICLLIAAASYLAGVATPPLYNALFKPNPSAAVKKASSASSKKKKTSTATKTKKSAAEAEVDNIFDSPTADSRTLQFDTDSSSSGSTKDDSKMTGITMTYPLEDYLHDDIVAGMHVIVFNEDGKGLKIYRHAEKTDEPITVDELPASGKWSDWKGMLAEKLSLRPADEKKLPWQSFSPIGDPLFSETHPFPNAKATDKLKADGMFLIMEGGAWVWPGVRKGFKRDIKLGVESTFDGTTGKKLSNNITLETISLYPLVLSVKGFLTEAECDWIQEIAAPMMAYSEVTLMDHDQGRPSTDFRTSQTAFLTISEPEIRTIDQRTASLVRIPKSHQEPAQVLRYGNTEKYDTHHDYFDPTLYSQDQRTLEMTEGGRKNRMATVFWYLTTVPKGGETVFPYFDREANSAPMFTSGLKVKPEKGKVIIFYSMTPDGRLDPYSLHGAAPVEEGIKWAANKWVWNAPLY